MSQKKKLTQIRDAFEEPPDNDDSWFTVAVSSSTAYKVEETGPKKSDTVVRSNSNPHPSHSKRKHSNATTANNVINSRSSLLSSSSESRLPTLYVATASTTTSPYSSPRTSVHNLDPQKLTRSDSGGGITIKSPQAPKRSDSLRKSGSFLSNFIPPPPSTPHPSTIKRPSASPLSTAPTTPIGSPKNAQIFSFDDDILEETTPSYRVEILHVIMSLEYDSKSAIISRSASTVAIEDISLRNLLHPLLPESWHLRGMQRKNSALYCVDKEAPKPHKTVYIEETWQVVSGTNPIDEQTFFGKNAILLACVVTSLVETVNPLTFHDKAVDCLCRLYQQALVNQLNPFIVLINGKPLKIPLRQAIAKHLISVGIVVQNLHWHGLSTTADSKFVSHIAEIWSK